MIFENGVLSVVTDADRRRDEVESRADLALAQRAMTLEQYGQLFVRAQDDFVTGSAIVTNVEAWNSSTWVRAAIEAIAFTIAQLPFEFWKGTDKVENHKLLEVLKSPNEVLGLSSFELWVQTLAIRELYGECFWLIERGLRGEPTAFWTYNPRNVKEYVRNGELLAWDFTFEGTTERVITDDVIHFSRFSPASHNPVRPSRGRPAIPGLAVSADIAAARYNLSFFARGAVPDGVYTSTSPDGLDEKSANAILDRIKSKLRAKGHEPILLSDGLTFTPTHQNARDAEFIGGRQMNREEILAAFKVPPVVVGLMKDASYATAREQMRSWWEVGLKPIMASVQDAFTRKLLKLERLTAAFSTDGVEALRRDRGEQIKQALLLTNMGVPYNVAEETLDIGTGPVPGGDRGYIPGGRVPAAEDGTDDAGAVLNGAQLAEAKGIIVDLATGAIPAGEAAVELLVKAGIDRPTAETMVSSTLAAKAKAPKPVADPEGAPPVEPGDDEDPPSPADEDAETPDDGNGEPAIDRELNSIAARIMEAPGTKTPPVSAGGAAPSMDDLEQCARAVLRQPRVVTIGARAEDGDLLYRLLAAIDGTDDALRDLMGPMFDKAFDLGAQQMKDALGLAAVFDVENAAAREFLDRKKIEVVGLNERTKVKLRKVVDDALHDGLTHHQIATRIRAQYNFSRGRAATIAQTEMAQTVNGARYLSLESEGTKKHEWVTAGGDLVRETHARENGHEIEVGKRFPVTDLRYPGDMTGAKSEIIRCRCISTPVFEDLGDADGDRSTVGRRLRDARTRGISETLAEWAPLERQMTRKIQRFLWEQRSKVLAAVAKT